MSTVKIVFFMFSTCINSIEALFIIPTDAHNYKIIGMLKTIKIPTIPPTCFGSRRNHQESISCLAKTTIMILLCSSLTASVVYWPLEPEFAGSNPAEAVGFFGRPENPQYAFLRRGSKKICPMSQIFGM